jgi:cytochrome c oxidase assembly factor CtaG
MNNHIHRLHSSAGSVMNPAGPSPSGLRLSMELEVDRTSWMVTMVTLATMVTVLLVLGWLLAFR